MADAGSRVVTSLALAVLFALTSCILFGCWIHRERQRIMRQRMALWGVSQEQYKAFSLTYEEYEWPTRELQKATTGCVYGSEQFNKAVATTLERYCGGYVV